MLVRLVLSSTHLIEILFFLVLRLTNYLTTDFQIIQPNEPYYCIYDEVTSSTKTYSRKGSEPVIVDYVAVDVKNKKHLQKVSGQPVDWLILVGQ